MVTLRNRNNAISLLHNLKEFGYTDSQMLSFIMYDFLSGEQAYDAVERLYNEFGLGEDKDETDENEETDEEILSKYQ